MDFKEYQEKASKTAIYPDSSKIIYPTLGLASEVGEVCGKIKKSIRDQHPIDVSLISKELGDVLWYISAICNDLNLKLDDVATGNIEKLLKRKENGTISGSGDDR